VLRLAAQGFTNREIGARLYLSRHTVKEYLSHAMRKLEVDSRVSAVVEAGRRGLLGPMPLSKAS
jgi:DNA-binding NarL/FixJ family response regulator